MLGRGGTAGPGDVPFVFNERRLVFDDVAGRLGRGAELAYAEFSVEEDFCEGTPLLELLEESEVRKLALERRRRSLKKAIYCEDVIMLRARDCSLMSRSRGAYSGIFVR